MPVCLLLKLLCHSPISPEHNNVLKRNIKSFLPSCEEGTPSPSLQRQEERGSWQSTSCSSRGAERSQPCCPGRARPGTGSSAMRRAVALWVEKSYRGARHCSEHLTWGLTLNRHRASEAVYCYFLCYDEETSHRQVKSLSGSTQLTS